MADLVDAPGDDSERSAVVTELGLLVSRDGDMLRGEAHSVPELWVPGSRVVRTSVLATWADVLAGLLSSLTIAPRIPVTLDLDVHLSRQPVGDGDILSVCEVVKSGRSVTVCVVRFSQQGNPEPFAVSHVSFMASPNPEHVNEGGFAIGGQPRRRLSRPFAERASCTVVGDGIAEVPRRLDGLNASGSINGGLIGLVAEEAARSRCDEPTVAVSLNLRYLRPFLAGPARAVAELHHDVAHVEVSDMGRDGRLSAVATMRLAATAG